MTTQHRLTSPPLLSLAAAVAAFLDTERLKSPCGLILGWNLEGQCWEA